MALKTEEILAALARGATVLTGRARAARALRHGVDRAKREAGAGGWEPPRVFAWDSWTAGLWREMLLRGDVEQMLLNRTQEMAVWRGVIEEDAAVATLRRRGALAAMAAQAWGEVARYGGLGRLAEWARNGDMEAFARWASAFEARCRERGYVAQARLEDALRQARRDRRGAAAEREVLLVGFDGLVPAQAGLLDDLRAGGCLVGEVEAEDLAVERAVLTAEDGAGEMLEAARWARRLLEERPSASLGVLVPGLTGSAALRAGIDRVFREVMVPEAQMVGAGVGPVPYEFSTGVGLDRTAAGRAALTMLRWAGGALDLAAAGEIMLSRHFAGGEERWERAAFEATGLRGCRKLLPKVTTAEMVEMLEGRALPRMRECLRRMGVAVERWGDGPRSYAEWAGRMREVLAAGEWRVSDDSAGFQVREAWEGALDEMATLDFEGDRVEYARALEALTEIVGEATFAPESRGAPVQVMGPDEAAGLRFDGVWMMRAGEETWPGRVGGSPLVSWALRRVLGMPGTGAARDLEDARQVSERIARAASEVVFSYGRQGAEGVQRASVALKGLGLGVIAGLGGSGYRKVEVLEVLADDVRLRALPDRVVAGGVGVLKAQAACAFHAFAEYRLFATEIEAREPGLDASGRGRVVHGMLEHFWAEVRTQAALRGMTEEARSEALGRAIDTTLGAMRVQAGSAWERAYVAVERERLMRLGVAWLVHEEKRGVAFEVERRESEVRDVAVGPVRLSVRLDRVDTTDEGSVLIDYKTGKAALGAWLGRRPDEPQIPLYAAFADGGSLHAVAFGMVQAGTGMKLAGFASSSGTVNSGKAKMEASSLEEQVAIWRDAVTELAEGFAGGDVRVSPKTYPKTCEHCAHRLICRLDVPSLEADEEDEDFGEDDLG